MTRRAAILTEIPFLGRSEDGAKRARVNEPLSAQASRENDQRVLERVAEALRDVYTSTQGEWIRRHWHAALAHADVAAEYAAKSGQTGTLLAAFGAAVDAECALTRAKVAEWLQAPDLAKAGEPIVLLLRNFAFRTRKRAETASALDATLFRPARQRGLAELANAQLQMQVLTPEIAEQISERVLATFHADFGLGVRLAIAYLTLFNEPGFVAPPTGPWKRIIDAVWEQACAENRAIVAEAANDPSLLADPPKLLATINGWILNVLRSGAVAYKLVVRLRNRGTPQALELGEKAGLARLAATPANAPAVWAEFALLAARQPLEAGATLKLLRQFYKHGRHCLWPVAEWPALFQATLARAVREYTDPITQHDVAWRMLAALSPGIAREHERRFREAFLREAHAVLGSNFFASVLRLLLLYRVGEVPQAASFNGGLAMLLRERKMGIASELRELEVENSMMGDLDDSAASDAAKAERYLEQTIYGDALPVVRACERLLHPMPPKLARTLLSAVLFANDLMIFDGGGYESALYAEIARLYLPAPLGEQRAVIAAQLQAFNDLTSDEFHNVVNLVNEIAAQENNAVLALNSGNWLCAKDPYLATNLPPALMAIVPSDARADPDTAERKQYKWHLTWSTVRARWRGGDFSCSWHQLEVLRKLWESSEPVSKSELVGDVPLVEFGEQLLQDLVQQSHGVVRHGTRDGETYYAIDCSVVPTGDWAVLEFADEWD